MMIVTSLAILAVDFPIFPRRFAKVETWGTSLMDLGVGSFVFSSGVVSSRSLLKITTRSGLATRFRTSLRSSLPLLILGFIRLYSVKGLDYAEHVTEYGVHWNFFFTLALLPPFVAISDSLTNSLLQSYNLLALLTTIIYEATLQSTPLLPYILISPRGPSLLSKNREGIFSFIGYLSIFLSGRASGLTVIPFNLPQPSTRSSDALIYAARERRKLLLNLLRPAIASTILYFLSTSIYGGNLTVSRRLANLPYVLWVVSFNNVQLLLFGLIEHFGPEFAFSSNTDAAGRATSQIMQAFNTNGLVVFLVANLATGLVNLSVNTLDMGDAMAMGVLIAYALAVTAVAMALRVSGVRIKL